MANNGAIRTWSTMAGLPVTTPTKGQKLGVVEDFYFEAGTNAVDSLMVNTGLLGYRALPVSAIKVVEEEAVIIDTAQAFLRELPPLPTGKSLLTYKVAGESGAEVGSVGEIYLGVVPTVAMRIAGIELASSKGKRAKRFSADVVLHYRQNTVILDDQDAKRLR